MTNQNNISINSYLKERFNQIEEYLIKTNSFYRRNQMYFFNIFYGLKIIEEKNMIDELNLDAECKFTYLLKLSNENKDELLEKIVNDHVLISIDNSELKKIMIYKIRSDRTGGGGVYKEIIKKIDSIVDIEEKLITSLNNQNNISINVYLKQRIKQIQVFLRKNGSGYGLNAMKIFNIFYGLKLIEEKNMIDQFKLKKPDCQFSYLLKLSNEKQDELLAKLIHGSILDSIRDSELKDIMHYKISRIMKGDVFRQLIIKIDGIADIEKNYNTSLTGRIYEYFIDGDDSTISEFGISYTNRYITNYILKKLNPSTNQDGTIPPMIDIFAGSGGFTAGYVDYLNKKSPGSINWNQEINKIHHYDTSQYAIESAGFELFCLTGELPNNNNVKYKNSFTDEFDGQKYKYIITNPPYGGDKYVKTYAQTNRDIIKKYIIDNLSLISDEKIHSEMKKQLEKISDEDKKEKKYMKTLKVGVSNCSERIKNFAKNNKLKGNDKESCSLMLMMDMLEFGGTAIGVLKEGIFFNRIYKDLRKYLIENFNVKEIISIPQDQFENTSTKTSIIIFDNNDEKTNEIKFSDLLIERYEEDKFAKLYDKIVVSESKGKIKNITDILVYSASKNKIIENNYSLNSKDYIQTL